MSEARALPLLLAAWGIAMVLRLLVVGVDAEGAFAIGADLGGIAGFAMAVYGLRAAWAAGAVQDARR